ncbi:MAG: hypothetical protein V4614_11965 [Pseudomonadota bacterium]
MASLSNQQLRFLKEQGVSLSQVIDASGLSSKDRVTKMETLGASFYYGGAICKAGGHSLRTKPGHCIQCDTSKIAYQLRHTASGHVYLAYSWSRQYAKVGYSKAYPEERVGFLCRENYGNANDWELKHTIFVSKSAGRYEFNIHARLEQYRKPVLYEKYGGVFVECREIFSCPLPIAGSAFENALRSL